MDEEIMKLGDETAHWKLKTNDLELQVCKPLIMYVCSIY